MKFDILAENIIYTIEEGRFKKEEKFSNIEVNGEELQNLLNSGALDSHLENLANKARYSNLSAEQLKQIISEITEEIKISQPSSFEELKDSIQTVADSVYSDKGSKRKTLVDRLTKSVGNIILSPSLGVVSQGEIVRKSENKPESNNLKAHEIELINFINQSEEPTTYEQAVEHIAHNFAVETEDAEQIVKKIMASGAITREGDFLAVNDEYVASEEDKEPSSEEEIEKAIRKDNQDYEGDEEEYENPLSFDREVDDTYRKTRGSDSDYYDSNL